MRYVYYMCQQLFSPLQLNMFIMKWLCKLTHQLNARNRKENKKRIRGN